MTWITRGTRRDGPSLARVMYRAVRQGATLYTMAERAAWVPKPPPARRFANRLATQDVWVARRGTGPVGFLTLRRDGYVDLAFILPEARGHGLFRALMTQLLSNHPGPLRTHASLHAQPAFAAMGFCVAHHEVVKQHGHRLRRALMIYDPAKRPHSTDA